MLWKGMDDSQRGRYYLSGIVRLQNTRIGDAMDCLHVYLRTVTDIHDIEWGLVSRVYLLAEKPIRQEWHWIIMRSHFRIIRNQYNIISYNI